MYASVTSVMAGPHGDSGYGFGEAREAARIRSEAPNARLAARLHDGRTGAPSGQSAPAADDAKRPVEESISTGLLLRGLGLAALSVLALRGLRPRN
jgi:hypothetical protein